MCRLIALAVLLLTSVVRAEIPATPQQWNDAVDAGLIDYYQDETPGAAVPPLDAITAQWCAPARAICKVDASAAYPLAAGRARARLQQAIVVEMSRAIAAGQVDAAKALRAELNLPRGVSANEGALLLQSLGQDHRDDAARLLAREAITWQTTRVRQLFDEAGHDVAHDAPMPGRLLEQLGEAITLAELPPAVREAGSVTASPPFANAESLLAEIQKSDWAHVPPLLATLREGVERRLPSLLTPSEKDRREHLLLKLVTLIPKEYSSGVRDGQVTVPLEYREAVAFTGQARQLVAELVPLWLSAGASVDALEASLTKADAQIAAKASPDDVESTLNEAAKILEGPFKISLRRSGTTADIVDEVMLEARDSFSRSLAAALAGHWADAERLRVEGYTTYDPDLEARLMPRDPQLAIDIERLLLDGIDQPGVKLLLDRHASNDELEAAYGRVNDALQKAAALLKGGISPTAAATSAASIVLREGLEGLLVIVAILAGLRGPANARRRKLIWLGIVVSLLATVLTWVLSQTLVTRLHAYGEIIEAVTGILAIIVLLLITNWLFHQVYWRQWVTTLKAQAGQGDGVWKLLTVGFLIGYREGFETVLFLQSLILDAGGKSVSVGVAVGSISLFILGFAALRIGLKLPYFRILMITALLIGLVLLSFVGGTVRSLQTISWLPVHRLTHGSWPSWLGSWFGLHNTIESVAIQVLTAGVVVGTWRVARWQAGRKAAQRRQAFCAATHDTHPPCQCAEDQCELGGDAKFVTLGVRPPERRGVELPAYVNGIPEPVAETSARR